MITDKTFVRVDRRRNFNIGLMNAVLKVTTTFRKKSICRNQFASHAAGSALSMLALRSCREKIISLRSAFESFTDLAWEEDFSYDKLKEHIMFLSELSSRLKQFLDEPASRLGEDVDARQGIRNRVNILNRILRTLPDTKDIMNVELPKIQNDLAKEINTLNDVLVRVARKISALSPRGRIQASKDKKKYGSIKKTMKAFFPALTDMKNAMADVAEKLDPIVEKVREDWRNDLSDLLLDADCKVS